MIRLAKAVILILCFLLANTATARTLKQRNVHLSLQAAERLAAQELVKMKYSTVPMVKTMVLPETKNSWVFVFEPKGQVPRPGSDVIVEVNKADGGVIVYPGR